MKKILAVLFAFLLVLNLNIKADAISAKAAVVLNGDTGEILFSRNANERLPMASTTKIMTALLLCENADLNETIVTTKEMVTVEGSSMGLQIGDTVSYHDLLYGMMLASGNDAANTTAIALSGSVNEFVKLMNNKAQEMGLKDTHFETPSGLDGNEHYTTAYELALITKYALQNENFASAAKAESATLCYGNPPYRRTLTNHNKLLKAYDDVIGVKTGYTKKSGRCLVSASKKDGKYVIAVTLNDPNDWADHRALLDLGLAALQTVDITPKQTKIKIPVQNGNENFIELEISSKRFSLKETENLRAEVVAPEFVYAPVNKGDKIGKVYYYLSDELILADDITSPINIKQTKQNTLGKITELLKFMLQSI